MVQNLHFASREGWDVHRKAKELLVFLMLQKKQKNRLRMNRGAAALPFPEVRRLASNRSLFSFSVFSPGIETGRISVCFYFVVILENSLLKICWPIWLR